MTKNANVFLVEFGTEIFQILAINTFQTENHFSQIKNQLLTEIVFTDPTAQRNPDRVSYVDRKDARL